MKKRVVKMILCLSLSAAMLFGEAGAVLADTTEAALASEDAVLESDDSFADRTVTEGDLTAEAEKSDVDALGAKVVTSAVLADVTGVAYDPATKVLSWNKVPNASMYRIEVYDAAGKAVDSASTSAVYYDLDDIDESFTADAVYTIKITAYNYSEICQVAANVAGTYHGEWIEAQNKYVWGIYSYDSTSGNYTLLYAEDVAYDIQKAKTVNGTTTYDLYKYPASINPAVYTGVIRTSTSKAVTALTAITVKETDDDGVTFSFAPSALQNGEYIKYTCANNAEYDSAASESAYAYSGTIYAQDGSVDDLYISYSDFQPDDTIYLKAYVYNPNFDYTTAGLTAESRKSAEVTTAYKVPASELGDLTFVVTKDSIRLKPYANGTVTGYQYQRKDGKKWITLAQQGSDYLDKGLKADTEYTYRVRGYVYNQATKKTVYTAWEQRSAVTWGTTLNLNVSAASTTSAKLTWSKVTGASGYEIYRKTTDSSAYNLKNGVGTEYFNSMKLVKTIKKAKTVKYTDKKLTKGAYYTYCVRAYRTIGKDKYYLDEYSSVYLSAKNMVGNTRYYTSGGNYVVKWNKMTGISGYKIEKINNTTGKYEAYKTLGKSATSFTFPKVAAGGASVTYRIRPYKGSKFYNGIGNITVAPKVATVKGVKAVQTAEGIKISWSPVAGADFYRVYRSTKDATLYNNTTKGYATEGGSTTLVYETNYQDTSAGISLVPTNVSDIGAKRTYTYSSDISNALSGNTFYDSVTAYKTSDITGTSVVDKTVSLTRLALKTEDTAYNKNTDPEFVAGSDYSEGGYYTGSYGRYQKNADGSLKTKKVIMNQGPKLGTEYYYYVVAYTKAANGAGQNDTDSSSIGSSKSAKVVYTNVSVKATKISSVKSSKKGTVTIKIKKASKVKGYAIYRSTKKRGTYIKIGTTTSTSYTDNNVTGGKTYYYKAAPIKQSENGMYVYAKLSAAKKVKVKK